MERQEIGTCRPFFPSSKKCCKCGSVKKELKLSDRVYLCRCGNRIDRDLNAAINIHVKKHAACC
ncbi:MAG: zinc ribbon domain-containing protein [Lachnospiraceae bacterium]